MINQEYGRFGPWILEVSERDPLPELYKPFIRNEAPLLRYKLPRPVERKRAHPGMHLYDYIISAHEDGLQILRRVENDVQTNNFRYSDLEGLRHVEDLLHGELILYLRNETYTIPYNTVSSDLIGKLMDLIRDRYTPQSTFHDTEEVQFEPEPQLSHLFMSLLNRERELNPHSRLMAVQQETPTYSLEKRRLRKMMQRVTGKKLLESLHFYDGRELKIISRIQTYRLRGQAVYGQTTTYIPVIKLKGIDWQDVSDTPGVIVEDLLTTLEKHQFTFVRDNPFIPYYKETLNRFVR